jgi:Na+/pantothenate symporter
MDNTSMGLAKMPAAMVGFLAVAPHLHKIRVLRRHQSPVDIITDRYQSQIFRYTTILLMIVPALISNSLFNVQPDSSWTVVGIAGISVLCEWIGGMRSVAFTDCIQGIIMIACFVALLFVALRQYGRRSDLERETYPRQSFCQTPSRDNNGCSGTLVSCSWALQCTLILCNGFTQPTRSSPSRSRLGPRFLVRVCSLHYLGNHRRAVDG